MLIDVQGKKVQAFVKEDGEWFVAHSPDMPGANGQGRTVNEAQDDLESAIALILEDQEADERSVAKLID